MPAHSRRLNSALLSPANMPNRSEYQPLAQSVDDEQEDAHLNDALPQQSASSHRMKRLRAPRPPAIDLSKLDAAFKRFGTVRHD